MLIAREALQAAVEIVKPAIMSSGSVAALKNVWWDGNYIYGYNGALGIRAPWKWQLPAGGVLASVLLGVLGSSTAKELDITSAGRELSVKFGRSTARLALTEATANPWQFKSVKSKSALTLDLNAELVVGLRRARIVKAANPTKVEHYGVVLFPTHDSLALYSTDSKTLAEVRVAGKFSQDLEKVVLPHAYVNQLLGLQLPCQITFLEDSIVAEAADGVQVCSNLLDTSDVWDLPKLTDDLLTEAPQPYIKFPDGWKESLSRATALAGSEPAYIKLGVSAKAKELLLTGKLAHGVLDERLPLAGKLAPGKATIDLGELRGLGKEAEVFAITKRAFVMLGKSDELYIVTDRTEESQEAEG